MAMQKENESYPQTDDNPEQEDNAPIEELTSNLSRLPKKGTVKWEKRSSERVTKKPDRWGNNVMITKLEKESHYEEEKSLPSVLE